MRAASPGSPSSTALSAATLVGLLCSDPQALAVLAQALVRAGLAAEVHASIDAALTQHARTEAGRRLAGVVSTATGAIIAASGGTPAKAMVFLGGGATAVACVLPPHLSASVIAGTQVWVEPVNGSMADLLIVSARA
jgi:hypothetical protein